MVVLFVILTIALFLTVDYFVQKRKKQETVEVSRAIIPPLKAMFQSLPGSIFMQPTFTWTKIMDSGKLLVGLQPALIGLVGAPDKIELVAENEVIRKGENFLRITHDNKTLQIKSPISGKITGVNSPDMAEMSGDVLGKRWFYAVEPENIAGEMPGWLIAEKAQSWLDNQYQKIKDFVMEQTQSAALGVTMADGGELPQGVLNALDDKSWKDFEQKFMA